MKVKYAFFGTPEFAATILKKLIGAGYVPALVVTAPDKPVGRKQVLTPPPTKIVAQKYDIPVWQPEKLKIPDSRFQIQNSKLFVVAAYGKILPKEILEIPEHGCLNVHPSLLPRWRGPSPIQYAILSGDDQTGTTIMLMDAGIDHGPILEFRIQKIENRNLIELSKILAERGAQLLIDILPKWVRGEMQPIEQDHPRATYSKIIKKEDGKIDWTKDAAHIERMARAFYPWPSAYTFWRDAGKEKMLKIIDAEAVSDEQTHAKENLRIGTAFMLRGILTVRCGFGALMIRGLQLEGGSEVSTKDFLNGHHNFIGNVLQSQLS